MKCSDYLICSEFLTLLQRADTNHSSQLIIKHQYSENCSVSKERFLKQFKPYIPHFKQFESVSLSTVKRQLHFVYDIFKKHYNTTKHPFSGDLNKFLLLNLTIQQFQSKLILYLEQSSILNEVDAFPLDNDDFFENFISLEDGDDLPTQAPSYQAL